MILRFINVAMRVALVAITTACATQPSRFYTLNSTAVAPAVSPGTVSKVAVVVGPVSIPALVDMPQMVLSSGSNQVTIDEYNRWAAPLQNSIASVVAENLAVLLGTPQVSLFQQSLNAAADYRVAIEVQRFESAPGEAATLNAIWIVRRTRDGAAVTGRTTVKQAVGDNSYGALAAAHSAALARMSEDVAAAIRAREGAGASK